jgi:predicted site-specific integrase-resolvase
VPEAGPGVSDPCASVTVVEHRDRLAGVGVERLPAARVARGPRMMVVEDGETLDDRVRSWSRSGRQDEVDGAV